MVSDDTMKHLRLSADPRYWVQHLYGPTTVSRGLMKHFFGSSNFDYLNQVRDNDKYYENAEIIARKISVQNTGIFENNATHIHGYGDVSWATDSQKIQSKKFLDAGTKIASWWKRKKDFPDGASTSLANENTVVNCNQSQSGLENPVTVSLATQSEPEKTRYRNLTHSYINKKRLQHNQYLYSYAESEHATVLDSETRRKLEGLCGDSLKHEVFNYLTQLLETVEPHVLPTLVERIKNSYEARVLNTRQNEYIFGKFFKRQTDATVALQRLLDVASNNPGCTNSN